MAVQMNERGIGHGSLTLGEGLFNCTVSHAWRAEKRNDPRFRESYRRMESLLSWWNVAELRAFVNRMGTAFLIFLAFWAAASILQAIVRRVNSHVVETNDLFDLLGRVAKLALIVFGLVTALGTAGLNVSAFVAGLGLTGFALGFAFRDVLSNLLAGVLILLYRPFVRGDRISVTGLEGTVTHIDLRYTNLEHDGNLMLIPNANLFTNPITVFRRAS
jgi:small conductance mechanosensitive channel